MWRSIKICPLSVTFYPQINDVSVFSFFMPHLYLISSVELGLYSRPFHVHTHAASRTEGETQT